MRIVKRVCVFFGAFLLYHIVFSNFFPVNEAGYLVAPDWYIYLGLVVATAAAWLDVIKNQLVQLKQHRRIAVEPAIEPTIPENTESFSKQGHTRTQEVNYTPSILESVDAMDGHAFEYWCADLLRDNGFVDVSVTRGSGDQGVDVLAEKEGIRYAIQCKCYSHDLGNTPVQEVNAGRIIYHCHIGAVMTNRYFTKGAKDAAEATGVLLWDRNWIKEHLTETKSEQAHTLKDPLLWDALNLIQAENCASVSIIQDGLGVGYARAARILDNLEELGYVGPFRGSMPREIIR